MKKALALIAVMVLSTIVCALGVRDGDIYKLNGRSVTVHVGPAQVDGYPVSVSDDSGTSAETVGIGNDEGGIDSTTGSMSTGSDKYDVKGGRMYRMNKHGEWVDMGRPRTSPTDLSTEGEGTLPGTEI